MSIPNYNYSQEHWQEEKVDRIRKDLTIIARATSTHYEDVDRYNHNSSASTVRSINLNIATDVRQYILNDTVIKKNTDLSRTATILSETAIVEGIHYKVIVI